MFKWLIKNGLNFIAKKLIDYFVFRLSFMEDRGEIMGATASYRSMFSVSRSSFLVPPNINYLGVCYRRR